MDKTITVRPACARSDRELQRMKKQLEWYDVNTGCQGEKSGPEQVHKQARPDLRPSSLSSALTGDKTDVEAHRKDDAVQVNYTQLNIRVLRLCFTAVQ